MTSIWVYRLLVLAHLSGFVVFLGAVSYQLLILLPAFSAAGTDRAVKYALMRAIKRRLRRVVGAAIGVLVVSGLAMASLRGLLRLDALGTDPRLAIFHWKLVGVTVLILTFAFALPLLQRVKRGALRGRLFVGVHVMVIVVGGLAALAGIALSR